MSASAPKPALQRPVVAAPAALRHLGRASVQLGMVLSLDACLLAAGLGAAIALRVLANSSRLGPLNLSPPSIHVYLLCGLCWLVMLIYEDLYRRDLQSVDQGDQLMKALTAGLVAAILLSFAVHVSNQLSRSVLLFWYGFDLLFFTLLRPLLRKWLVDRPLVLVVAEQPTSANATCVALHKLGFPTRFIPLGADPPHALEPSGPVVLCLEPRHNLPALLARWERNFSEIAIFAGATPVTPLGAKPVNLHGVQLFALRHPLDHPLNWICKRGLDLAGASLMLVLTGPVLLLLMAAIKLDSRGPVFYRQARLGRHGRPFQILKFRTMRADADACLQDLLRGDAQASYEFSTTFKLKNDPRITKVGRYMRRYSLDELPQLWNVLVGEMSLVGPRPIVEAEAALYAEAYSIVSSTCPGMTGLWQTSGRSDVSYESRRGFDIAYVRSWSLWRDISILLRTIAAVLSPNAY